MIMRPDWPPRYVNVPVEMIRDEELPQTAFRLGCKLRALSWGDPVLRMKLSKLLELTGLSRSRFYEYARALSVRTPLRWAVRNDDFECSFNEDLAESRKAGRQSRNPGLQENASIKDLNTDSINTNTTASRKSGIPESGIAKVDYFPLATALADVCHMKFDPNKGRLFREAKLLSTADPTPTPDLLRQHYNGDQASYWRRSDWRGRAGQDPSPSTIRETWGKWGTPPPAENFIDYN